MAIDKNIIQMHKGYSSLGPFERVSLERWKLLNPGWNYMFFSNDKGDAVVAELLGERYNDYRKFHFGARNNIRRLALLFKLGGVYADIDMYPLVPLDNYVSTDRERVLFSCDGDRNLFHNSILASSAGDPMTMDIINLAIERLTTRPQPHATNNHSEWKDWHFNACGVHCFNDVYHMYEKLGDAVAGADSDPNYAGQDGYTPLEGMKNYHMKTGCWTPESSGVQAGEMHLKQMMELDRVKERFGI